MKFPLKKIILQIKNKNKFCENYAQIACKCLHLKGVIQFGNSLFLCLLFITKIENNSKT